MCQKYEKPLIIPFSSDDSEVGIGLCANGSANPTSNCENGASAPARHCRDGGSAGGQCQVGTSP
jgi:hypothetical protein